MISQDDAEDGVRSLLAIVALACRYCGSGGGLAGVEEYLAMLRMENPHLKPVSHVEVDIEAAEALVQLIRMSPRLITEIAAEAFRPPHEDSLLGAGLSGKWKEPREGERQWQITTKAR